LFVVPIDPADDFDQRFNPGGNGFAGLYIVDRLLSLHGGLGDRTEAVATALPANLVDDPPELCQIVPLQKTDHPGNFTREPVDILSDDALRSPTSIAAEPGDAGTLISANA
jgi:hypothetical protein